MCSPKPFVVDYDLGHYFSKQFSSEIFLPSETIELGSYCFKWCDFSSIIIPENVSTFHRECFYCCRNLQKIGFLGNSLKTIDAEAFSNCISLEKIIFPDGLEFIGRKCFARCVSLKTIIFPPSLKYVGSSAFCSCESLEHVIFLGKTMEQLRQFEKYDSFIADIEDKILFEKAKF